MVGNLFLIALAASTLGQASDPSPHSDLALSLAAVDPGKSVTIAATITLEPKWHCYWVNPGDNGTPTMLTFRSPLGWKHIQTTWATPHRLDSQGMTAFGYEDKAVALITFSVAPSLAKKPASLTVDGNWLVCQEACVPASQSSSVSISAESMQTKRVLNAQLVGLFPVPDHGKIVTSAARAGEDHVLRVSRIGGLDETSFQFFPDAPGLTDHGAPVAKETATGWELVLKKSPYADKAPRVISGILTFRADRMEKAYKIYQVVR